MIFILRQLIGRLTPGKKAPTLSDLPERVPAELAGCSERKKHENQ